MRATLVDRYGPPEVIRVAEVPMPTPKPDEVLIRVEAAAVTPTDCAFRSGKPSIVRLFAGLRRPRSPILGDLMAGEVVEVGASVTAFAVGHRVFGSPAPPTGAYAEYRCVRATGSIARIPAGLDYAEAAAIADGAMTALPFLRDDAKVRPGMNVLINGAAGAIGTSAVQIAKHFGADVTAVCGAGNAGLVRALGADHMIDYTREDFTRMPAAFDVIFDVVGKSSFGRCRNALRPGGVYLTTVPSRSAMALMVLKRRRHGKRGVFAATGLRPDSEKARDLAFISELVAAGLLRGAIGRTFPLDAIVEAHRYVETGHKRGSAILAVGRPYAANLGPSGGFLTEAAGGASRNPAGIAGAARAVAVRHR